MNKNKLMIFSVTLLVFATGLNVQAQTSAPAPTPAPATAPTAPKKGAAPAKITKIKIDYENETVLGNYDTPDAQFINSRRMIKFKELFNRRTNFIEEVEANKGLFNEYQK